MQRKLTWSPAGVCAGPGRLLSGGRVGDGPPPSGNLTTQCTVVLAVGAQAWFCIVAPPGSVFCDCGGLSPVTSCAELRSQLRFHHGPGEREESPLSAGRQRGRGHKEGVPLPVAWPHRRAIHTDSVRAPISLNSHWQEGVGMFSHGRGEHFGGKGDVGNSG